MAYLKFSTQPFDLSLFKNYAYAGQVNVHADVDFGAAVQRILSASAIICSANLMGLAPIGGRTYSNLSYTIDTELRPNETNGAITLVRVKGSLSYLQEPDVPGLDKSMLGLSFLWFSCAAWCE